MSGRSDHRRRGGPRKTRGALADDFANDAPPRMITTSAELIDACAHIREQGAFAFDTEFVMEDVYRPEVCVVQLATADLTAVVDPFEVKDLSPVWELVADPGIEAIVHAGMEDLALCFEQGGLVPQKVFDCQIVAGLVNTDFPLSLARLTRYLLGVRLHKSQTLTDWRRRPLSEAQMRYAADDVRYLPAARRELGRKLTRLGRTEWVDEEMARFHRPEFYVRGTDESVLKLKGAGSLDGAALAIARELLRTRAELADRFNRPARAVVRDHLLVEIARHAWTDPAQIKTLRGLSLRPAAIQALADAVKRARALPPAEWPTPAPVNDETEREAALALLVGAVIHSYCADADIAHQLVATKRDVRQLVCALARGEPCAPDVALANGWRAATIGSAVRELLAGSRTVTVARDAKGPHVNIR